MSQNKALSPKPIMSDQLMRSFGRVKGRKLRPESERLVNDLLPKVAVDTSSKVDLSGLFEGKEKFCLEIGFGRGEHLAQYAKENPDVGCIGCEPYINGVSKLLKYMEDDSINNIRICHGDARVLLEQVADNSLDKVFVLFPDPWPKARHHKKRIINNVMLKELSRVLKDDAVLEVATDHVDYGDWIAEHLEGCEFFAESEVTKGKRTTPPSDWIRTNYQQKAEKQGRGSRFFHFLNKK